MAEVPEGSVYECPKCKKEVEEGIKFCAECGSRIKWLYPERTCTHCGNVWRPRKANPKTCSACGYQLARDNVVEIERRIRIRDIGDSIVEDKCVACGKRTRRIVEFNIMDDPIKNACYVCMEDYFHNKNAEDTEDIVEGSFVTIGIERLEDGTERLIKE